MNDTFNQKEVPESGPEGGEIINDSNAEIDKVEANGSDNEKKSVEDKGDKISA